MNFLCLLEFLILLAFLGAHLFLSRRRRTTCKQTVIYGAVLFASNLPCVVTRSLSRPKRQGKYGSHPRPRSRPVGRTVCRSNGRSVGRKSGVLDIKSGIWGWFRGNISAKGTSGYNRATRYDAGAVCANAPSQQHHLAQGIALGS